MQEELASAQQGVLYAQAETQNVRRRLEKDIADARAYGVTGFARDILAIADNLARALDAVSPEMREDDKLKNFITGIEATQREVDKVFAGHGITRIASTGLPLDPNQHQAMLEIPSNEVEPGTIVQEMQAGYMLKERPAAPRDGGGGEEAGLRQSSRSTSSVEYKSANTKAMLCRVAACSSSVSAALASAAISTR